MTYGQLIDAVVAEAARLHVTLDAITFERHRTVIDGIAFTFTEGDHHSRHVVGERETRQGDPGELAEWVCYRARDVLRRLSVTASARAAGV